MGPHTVEDVVDMEEDAAVTWLIENKDKLLIDPDSYQSMEEDCAFLNCLQAAGVVNRDGYDRAVDISNGSEEDW